MPATVAEHGTACGDAWVSVPSEASSPACTGSSYAEASEDILRAHQSRLRANAWPEPDFKYRSKLRA